ncbi:hypothetical protein ACWER9_04405 [Micromonospora sp. NPDC003944]
MATPADGVDAADGEAAEAVDAEEGEAADGEEADVGPVDAAAGPAVLDDSPPARAAVVGAAAVRVPDVLTAAGPAPEADTADASADGPDSEVDRVAAVSVVLSGPLSPDFPGAPASDSSPPWSPGLASTSPTASA